MKHLCGTCLTDLRKQPLCACFTPCVLCGAVRNKECLCPADTDAFEANYTYTITMNIDGKDIPYRTVKNIDASVIVAHIV